MTSISLTFIYGDVEWVISWSCVDRSSGRLELVDLAVERAYWAETGELLTEEESGAILRFQPTLFQRATCIYAEKYYIDEAINGKRKR